MRKEILLPAVALVGGGAGFFLRRWELASAFEPGTGLPIPGAPASIALVALSVLLAAALILLCRGGKTPFSGGYDQAFAARGNTVYFTLVVLSALLLLGSAALTGYLFFTHRTTQIMRLLLAVLCLASAVGLFVVAQNNYRGRGKGKFSVALLLPAYACCLWLIAAYQVRAGDPVRLDYLYELLAIIATLLGLYFMAGFAFERAKVFRASLFSLLGVYFSMVTLADAHDVPTMLLYGGMALYLLTNVVTLLYNVAHPLPAPPTDSLTEEPTHE